MVEIIVPLNDEGNVQLQLPERLAGRSLALDLFAGNDPVRSINSGLRSLAKHLTALLDDLDAIDGIFDPNKVLVGKVLRSFEDVIYTTSEVFESYEKSLTKTIVALSSSTYKTRVRGYLSAVKRHRDDWTFLTNKLKHENNHLAPVAQKYTPSLRVVHGFSLIKPEGIDGLNVNKAFHKKRERSRSYNLQLRQLIFDVLKVDSLAAALVDGIEEDNDATCLPHYSLNWSVGRQLERILQRPMWPLPEEPRTIDGFKLEKKLLRTERQVAAFIYEAGQARVEFEGDGVTTKFPII
ncbi:hypothetical protein [Sphingomonas hankookensis]|uniref:hypothetical protein n=1 Tax=Sphingomonas hankookensis TaxID=563996 RepID=UPI00234F1017|nr:hypothetical protein [Sphingomonas hankookensis]WCP72194.1 hypothetical protein PPZ50_01110 [Sphingomonas hankookensis]